MNRYRCSGPIHKQRLAGLVFLPQHHILFPPPPLVQLAEAAVLVAVRVCLPVLLPQQLLRHVWMLLPLTMKIGEVGHRQHRRTAARRAAEQRGLKPVIVPLGSVLMAASEGAILAGPAEPGRHQSMAARREP